MTFPAQTPLTTDALRAAVKLALRITSTAYDDEIDEIIAAARADLIMSGVSAAAVNAADPDPLIKRAITVYAKAQFGLDNPDSEKFMLSYHSLETHLALSAEYSHPVAVTTGGITTGTSELTVASATGIAVGSWVTVAGAGADGSLLISSVDAVDDLVITLTATACTTVTTAEVKVT